jgi:hypothetical protein
LHQYEPAKILKNLGLAEKPGVGATAGKAVNREPICVFVKRKDWCFLFWVGKSGFLPP